MNNVIAILDDTIPKSEVIRDVIGMKGFTDVVVKRKPLREYFSELLQVVYPMAECQIVRSIFDAQALLQQLEESYEPAKVIHWFADYLIFDREAVKLTWEKLNFIEDVYLIADTGQQVVGIMFPSLTAYRQYLRKACKIESVILQILCQYLAWWISV